MPKQPTQAKATVLVIDDDQSIRDAIHEGLSDASIIKLQVFEAEDVKTALIMTRQHKPDIIILDLGFEEKAPRHGGFDFLESIRSDPKLKHTKVIVLTANDTLENMRIAEDFDVSVYNFISKPFSIDDLIAQVYSLILDKK